jgi:hypothetical protein
MKSRKMRWAGHVAHMGDRVVFYTVWGILRERDNLEDPHIEGRIKFIWIFR